MSEIVKLLDTTRFGRVLIDVKSIKGGEHLIKAAMGKLIPISTVFHKDTNMIEYIAISDEFQELDQKTELIPIYFIVNKSDGSVEFIRKSFKRKIDESVKDEIVKFIIQHNVNMDDFKAYIRKFTKATDEDFDTYDENFLEALHLYVNRQDNDTSK